MAATFPSGEPDRDDDAYERPTLASAPASSRRPAWLGIVIAVVVIAVIAVIAYLLLYNGGGGNGGGDGGGGGTTGYSMIAFSGEAIRRLARKFKH